MVPLPIVLALLLLTAACSSAPSSPPAPEGTAGIRKLEAQVRGVT